MYEIHIESEEFREKRTVQQHQMVNQVRGRGRGAAPGAGSGTHSWNGREGTGGMGEREQLEWERGNSWNGCEETGAAGMGVRDWV